MSLLAWFRKIRAEWEAEAIRRERDERHRLIEADVQEYRRAAFRRAQDDTAETSQEQTR